MRGEDRILQSVEPLVERLDDQELLLFAHDVAAPSVNGVDARHDIHACRQTLLDEVSGEAMRVVIRADGREHDDRLHFVVQFMPSVPRHH